MMMQSVSSDLVHTPASNNHHYHPTSLPDNPTWPLVHPLLLIFFLIGTCFCLIMAYYLDSNRRSTKASKTTPMPPFSEESKTKTMPVNTKVGPGDWLRPLGNLETFMEIGGEYGSLNTCQAIWLSSKQPILVEDVRQAVLQVAKKTEVLHVCIEWRGMRPWFKRMNDFVFDFEVIEDDVMSVFYYLLHKVYDMAKGPLWGARLVPLPKRSPEQETHEAVLMIMAHHCITDGHTNMTFCRDIMRLLNATLTGGTYEVPMRPLISAASDSLISKKDWYYVFRYFWSKMFDAIIRNYSSKVYIRGAVVQPQTKVAITKLMRTTFTVDETKELLRHCKASGVTVHSCIMAAANLAWVKTIKQRSKHRIEAARINTVNCINMRRYFSPELKESAGCHISLEEKEMLIPISATKSKEEFWSLVKVFQKNLNDSLNVHYFPIKNTPLFRPSTILLHANYELTKRGRKNRTDNHMISTNMGNLKDLLPGKYNGPVEITDIMRSVSSELTGNPLTLVFHTFMDKFMISVDYYTTKIPDEVAAQFFSNLVTHIGNIARYGTVQGPDPTANVVTFTGNVAKYNAVQESNPTRNGFENTSDVQTALPKENDQVAFKENGVSHEVVNENNQRKENSAIFNKEAPKLEVNQSFGAQKPMENVNIVNEGDTTINAESDANHDMNHACGINGAFTGS